MFSIKNKTCTIHVIPIIATKKRPITYGCYELCIHVQEEESSYDMSYVGLENAKSLSGFDKLFNDLGVKTPTTNEELKVIELAAFNGETKVLGNEWF